MKAAADFSSGSANDFYASTLAPLSQRRACRFCAADALLLTVLFLELAGVMRFLLAR